MDWFSATTALTGVWLSVAASAPGGPPTLEVAAPAPMERVQTRTPEGRSGAPAGLQPIREVLDDDGLQALVDDIAREVEDIRGRTFRTRIEGRYTDHRTVVRATTSRYIGEVEHPGWRSYELMVQLLGLVPGDVHLPTLLANVIEEQVGSYYDREEAVLWLDDDQPMELAQERIVTELARALDDQHYDFGTLYANLEGSSDRFIALQAVIEGSARATLVEWRHRHRDELDEKALRLATQQQSFPAMATTPPAIWKPMLAYVHRGYTFLCRSSVVSLMVHGVRVGDVDRAYEDLPLSSEQILHPVKYWKSRRLDRPRDVRCDVNLSSDWTLLREDTLGELNVALLTEPFAQRGGPDGARLADPGRVRFTNEAADGWGGDRVVVLEHEQGLVLRASFRWDQPVDAQEFYEAVLSLQTEISGAVCALEARPDVVAADRIPCGVRVEYGEHSDEVLMTAWVGLGDELVEEARKGTRFFEVVQD